MGWYRTNGWGGYGEQGWSDKYYGRNNDSQKKNWGSWKCECGNV